MRKFGPKSEEHFSIGDLCKICEIPFKEGDFTTLIPTKPADEEEAQKMNEGRLYTSEAIEIHWDCRGKLNE